MEKEYVRKCNINTAKKEYENGGIVYLATTKANIFSEFWGFLNPIKKNTDSQEVEMGFESLVNSFKHYNCGNEMGYGVKYFILSSTPTKYMLKNNSIVEV
jgi:hypothetical protein